MRKHVRLYLESVEEDINPLSSKETGAYFRLILQLFKGNTIPQDDQAIANLIRLPIEEWMWMKARISRLFTDTWTSPTVDIDLRHAKYISETRKEVRSRALVKQKSKSSQAVVKEQSLDNEEMVTKQLREQVVSRFLRRGLAAPDHLSQIGIWVGMGYSPKVILATVDRALEERGARFTSMNFVDTMLSVQKEKHSPKATETQEPPQMVPGSPEWWADMIDLYKTKNYWSISHITGMRPGTPGCLCPKEILEKYGLPPTPPFQHDIIRKNQD